MSQFPGVNFEAIMKEFATAIMGFRDEIEQLAGRHTPPQTGGSPAGEPGLPAPAPAGSAPLEATSSRTVAREMLPLAKPLSVVAKVAKLLGNQPHDPVPERPAHWENGCVHQKALASLNTAHPL